jgi:hypothetical protein
MSKEIVVDIKKEFLLDLIKAQTEIETVYKDKINPHFKNKYVPLCDILAAIKPALNKNNFFLTQKVSVEEGGECLKTEIIHINGESLSMSMPLVIAEKGNPQKYGSAMTYMRRYSLTALLALEEEDDDGEKAAQNKKSNSDREKLANIGDSDMKETLRNQNEKDFRELKRLIEGCGSTSEIDGIIENNKKVLNKIGKYAPDLFKMLKEAKETMVILLDPENEILKDVKNEILKDVKFLQYQ